MRRLARFVLKHAGWVALLGTCLGGIASYYSFLLYKNLRTDLEELLPTTARSVLDLDRVTQRLESIENLAILIFCDDPVSSKRFVNDLAKELKKLPRDTLTSVEYRIDKELEFFKKRRALYIELEDLKKIKTYIEKKISYEKSLYNPLNIFSETEIAEPQLDLKGMQKKYDSKISSYSRFPDGYYATPDGKKRVVLVYMPGKASGIGTIHKLKNAVVETIQKLNPSSYHPGLEIKYTGGVQNTLEEQAALVADLALSTIIVIVLVAMALIIFYKAFWSPTALIFSLFVGTFWTFGLTYFVVGYLNANSAFLGSIVIGNGINFGIILLARYTEELRKRKKHEHALAIALTHTATATWTAALAAGLAYGSLMLTGFRGFNQFGVIGLMGMVLCWISTFTVLPAYLTLLNYFKPIVQFPKKQKNTITLFLSRIVNSNPKKIWAFSFAITLLSLLSFIKFDSNTFIETDLRKLRNKTSMEKGSGYLSKHVDEIFQRYLSPLVILPENINDVLPIKTKLENQRLLEGQTSLMASVQSLDDFIPPHQSEKIKILNEIKILLPDQIKSRLPKEQISLMDEYLTPEAFQPIEIKDLPELVKNKFKERDGSLGKMVLVTPPLNKQTNSKNNLLKLIDDLRRTADGVSPNTPVAGGLVISADMMDAISKDGPKATAFAFLAVIILVFFVYKKVASLILVGLLLGVTWLVGIILWFDLKINFLNFIALPITFGIGVDYGVNIFQRYREEGGKNILRVIRDTGGAVALCSFTTIVGYGSLIVAENQAFVSFGLIAILGEFTCLIAAVVALPAYLLLQERRIKKA